MQTVKKNILKSVYKKRKKDSHKGDFGRLMIIGGNEYFTGAPALAGLAAYRSGVDLVTIYAPSKPAHIIPNYSPDLITVSLNSKHLVKSDLKLLLKSAETKNSVLIGNGLGEEKATQKAVQLFVNKVKIPCVIDADGITAIIKNKKVLKNKKIVLTPHEQEFLELTGIKVKNVKLLKKTKIVQTVAKNLGVVILLKGQTDIISDGKKIFVNKTGTVEMTVGGTGDVLAGVTASLIAQGNDLFESACAAAYITGKAGEKAVKTKKVGLMASDVIEEIPNIL